MDGDALEAVDVEGIEALEAAKVESLGSDGALVRMWVSLFPPVLVTSWS